MKRKSTLLYCFFISASFVINAQQYTSKVLLIPLDDRPPCLQFPVKMGLIGDVEILTPPRTLLGRFTQFGISDSIIVWLKKQDLRTFDAVIMSMDMLAYGGLVASRVHETLIGNALKRLEIIKEIRQKAPKIKIYGSSVIMRLAPTSDGKNETYREKLARWAEYSPYSENKEIVEKLESDIPTEALETYKKARERNLKINLFAIDLIEKNTFDYLILSQDDAKPKGVHVQDRETLRDTVKTHNLSEKVSIQPGADEVSMLLLARALSDKYNYHPKIYAVYSTEKGANQVMPFEDRPLSKTVSSHLKAVGAEEVSSVEKADILFYVFASRFDEGRVANFAHEIFNFNKNKPKKGIILADIDPKGDVQGGDTVFTEGVLKSGVFTKIYGYASWNTAGNTIGTALSQGILYSISQAFLKQKSMKKVEKRMAYAQKWFTLNRLLDDYTYHTLVRPMALKKIKDNKWNAFQLTNEQTATIEAFCLEKIEKNALKIVKNGFPTEGVKLSKLSFDLPWNRAFEAEIDFEIH
jgi:Protein of unknown function (DUF4127)